MRLFVETDDGQVFDDVMLHRDESFLQLRRDGKDRVVVIPWERIRTVKKKLKGQLEDINIETLQKIRE